MEGGSRGPEYSKTGARYDDIGANEREPLLDIEQRAQQSLVQLLNARYTISDMDAFYRQNIVPFPFQSMRAKNAAYHALEKRASDIVGNVLSTFRTSHELVQLQRDLLKAEFISEDTLRMLQAKIERSMHGAEHV